MNVVQPQWPAPTWVRALTTTCAQGNMALPRTRDTLCQSLGLKNAPGWLRQVHGTALIQLPHATLTPDADGAWTQSKEIPCAVFTADCLPLLFTDQGGSVVAAVHCGWRGIANGIIENTVKTLQPIAKGSLLAWLGPAIGPACFEVGAEVRQAFIDKDFALHQAFLPGKQAGKWMGNLYQLATLTLRNLHVVDVYGGDQCTFSQENHFYSYRRQCNERMATLIWLT